MNQRLYESVLVGDYEECKRCIDDGADVNYIPPRHEYNTCYKNILHTAVVTNNIKCIELLIEAGANSDIQNIYGETLFHHVSSIECLELLLKSDNIRNCINTPNRWGNTPLHVFCMNGKRELVDVNISNWNGWTPLHFASYHNQKTCVEILLAYHAQTDIQSKRGKTGEDLAREKGYDDIVNLIQCFKFKNIKPSLRPSHSEN